MSLNPTAAGQDSDAELQTQISRGADFLPAEQMSAIFADIYVNYSLQAECGGVDVSAGGDDSVLTPAFITDNSPAVVTQIADAICDYWSSIDTPGDAAVLDEVVSVTVNGDAQKSAMADAIQAYADGSGNGWAGFYEAIQSVVEQIEVTVVELNTGTGATTPFTRSFS